MNHVLAHGQSEVAADGAWGGLGHWVRAAGQLTPSVDGALALNDACNQWCGGDEVHQLAEERLIGVLFVVLLSGLAVSGAEIQLHQLQALALDAGDDFANVAVLDAVWLDQDECTFSHGCRFYSPRAPLARSQSPFCAGLNVQVLARQQAPLHALLQVIAQVVDVPPHGGEHQRHHAHGNVDEKSRHGQYL